MCQTTGTISRYLPQPPLSRNLMFSPDVRRSFTASEGRLTIDEARSWKTLLEVATEPFKVSYEYPEIRTRADKSALEDIPIVRVQLATIFGCGYSVILPAVDVDAGIHPCLHLFARPKTPRSPLAGDDQLASCTISGSNCSIIGG